MSFFLDLYLRLFYTEEFLGWNGEEWPSYLSYSLATMILVATILSSTRHFFPARLFLSTQAILVFCLICTPLCVVLFFAAGRVSMLPIPPGVHAMSRFGCCSQGLIFPYESVPGLISWFESKKVGFADMLTEEYGDENNEIRWALTPSVLQHVGKKSSKVDDYGEKSKHHRSVAENIWNFAFETNDHHALRREHIAQSMEN
jgi:hypothetical protein